MSSFPGTAADSRVRRPLLFLSLARRWHFYAGLFVTPLMSLLLICAASGQWLN